MKQNNIINQWAEKHYKSLLINVLVVNWVIFFIFLLFIFFYLLPQYSIYKENKNSLFSNINEYENINKNWLSYSNFKSTIPSDDKVLVNIANQMWEDFYNSSLKNTGSWNYLSFLDQKESFINDLKKKWIIEDRENKLSKILPFYVEWSNQEWSITELGFINYIETLLRTFSLRTNSEIWITNISPVEADSKNTSSEIFYTDLALKLEWKKTDILDFLYFIQNVWNISIENMNWTQYINVHNDKVVNKTIVSQRRDLRYNVYENQIADVISIDFSKYIDTSTDIRSESQKSLEWFISFVRNSPESSDTFTIDSNIRFYFRWLPTYKIEMFVDDILKQYNQLSKNIETSLNKSQNRKLINLNSDIITVISNLRSLDTFMKNLKEKHDKMRWLLNKRQNLENLYYQALDFKYDLDYVKPIYEKNNSELTKISNIK